MITSIIIITIIKDPFPSGPAKGGQAQPPIMRRRKRRARRERVTFFTILPTHGVTAAATLSRNIQREVIHVPIDSGPVYFEGGVEYGKSLFCIRIYM